MLASAVVLGPALVAAMILYLLQKHLRLKNTPRPIGTAVEEAWCLAAGRPSNYQQQMGELHQKNGEVVRLEPGFVSLSDVEDIAQAYRVNVLDEVGHDRIDVLGYQSTWRDQETIDNTLRGLVQTIRRYKTVDITTILGYFVDQLSGQLSNSAYHDADVTAQSLPGIASSSSVLATLEELLLQGPVSILKRKRLSCHSPPKDISNHTHYRHSRAGTYENMDSGLGASFESLRRSFVLVIPFLLQHPSVMQKLRAEVESLPRFGNKSTMPYSRDFASALYLEAVLNETLRLVILQEYQMRINLTTKPLHIFSKHILSGALIVWHPNVVLSEQFTFGDEPDAFRPERWLDSDRCRLDLMKRSLLPFAVCRAECEQVDSAWLLLKKTVVVLLREFDDLQMANTQRLEEILRQMTGSRSLPSILIRVRPRSTIHT
ncbi:cytochrome P450 [Aspergillus unguis]